MSVAAAGGAFGRRCGAEEDEEKTDCGFLQENLLSKSTGQQGTPVNCDRSGGLELQYSIHRHVAPIVASHLQIPYERLSGKLGVTYVTKISQDHP